MKKILLMGFSVIVLGLGFGVASSHFVSSNEASASSSEKIKIDEVKNGKAFVNSVEIDPETGVPVEADKQKTKKITKDSPEAKERYITLRVGETKKVVARISYKEFLENQDYYNDLLEKETKKAFED